MHSKRGSILQIDLDALNHNFSAYKKLLYKQTLIMGMVKANAYGSGLIQIARHLVKLGVHYLGVAHIEEGIKLRKAGISTPILVFLPNTSTLKAAEKHDLQLGINTLNDIQKIIQYAKKNHTQLAIHLNLDTGMNRLGITPDQSDILHQTIQNNIQHIKITGIYSHLAAAGEPQHDQYTEKQFVQFEQWTKSLSQIPHQKPLLHLLNSDGIERFATRQYDMVRIGIGLYGIRQTIQNNIQLKPVHQLSTKIIRLRQLKAGQSVGYSRMWYAKRDSLIATIPLGYADGIFRQSGITNNPVSIKGQKAPMVGLISMDSTMIDVTDIKDGVAIGDEVILFGKNMPIQHICQSNHTIAYEILSRISNRVKRTYRSNQP